jgi:hypothetical protein
MGSSKDEFRRILTIQVFRVMGSNNFDIRLGSVVGY